MTGTLDFYSLQPLSKTIPSVSSAWTKADMLDAIKIRWGIGRNTSIVSPGLYKIGKADSNSDVFVSANYKLSFDLLRRNLESLDAWILVLDTKGVNVWCAAGKGNFDTNMLVQSIEYESLKNLVTHRRVIVPQLAAVGIAAHKVKEQTSFKVIFGPVRAKDISEFVRSGYTATPKMRQVQFPLYERAKLIPVDLMYGKYKLLIALLIVFIISGLDRTGFHFEKMISGSLFPTLNILTAYFAGIVVTPLLLPFLPFRAFAAKGAVAGLFSIGVINLLFQVHPLERIALLCMGIAISSFMAMNFTGSSTYTSLSGVKLEMKWSIPIQIGLAVLGIVIFILSKLL